MKSIIPMLSSLVFASLFLSAPTAAEIYKWVDEHGRVHYTDSPPPNKGTKVEIDVRQPPAQPDEGELRRRALLDNAEIDFQHNRRRKASEHKTVATLPDAARCKQSRVNWSVLHENMPVYRTTAGDLRTQWLHDTYQGERRYIEDRDRPALRTEMEDDIFRYCADPYDTQAIVNDYQAWIDDQWCDVESVKLAAARNKRSRTPKDKVAQIEANVNRLCR